MDLTVNTDKRITETADIAITAHHLDTLANLLEESFGKNLPIHSRESRIKFNGCIMYWLKLVHENGDVK